MSVTCMPHPWRPFTENAFKLKFGAILTLTIACLTIVLVLDQQLKSNYASGYSSLEYAGDVVTATNVIASWDVRQRTLAGFSSGFHFLFMLGYSTTLMLTSAWAANRCPVNGLGDIIAWAQPFAAVADAVLQSILVFQLANGVIAPLPSVATAFGVIHTIILAIGALFSFVTAILSCCHPAWKARPTTVTVSADKVRPLLTSGDDHL
eukprot:TRINITY_DN14263_c0_g1_i1.p1 TRINITY_DN14263_c0_g1~~TRINITY_DN14263_c0_g1_i1.p1  ORF type:complete len:207 (-),score=22.20 TRINITY_DN14263_c0_g1_i1:115-735(-)